MSQEYFAIITPGLEEALSEELRGLPVRKRQVEVGGVSFQATGVGLCHVMWRSRLASRVYLRIDEFRARDPMELFRKSRRIEWSQWLSPGTRVKIEASLRQSRFRGPGAVADRVWDGFAEYWLEQHPNDDPPERVEKGGAGVQRLLARVEHKRCTLSLDAAGVSMHRRGWRLEGGSAPIRENLACACLSLLGWEASTPLVDPCCGSGTFAIEAARWARGLSPRVLGAYDGNAFLQWANAQPQRWSDVISSPSPGVEAPQIWGFDIDPEALSMASENAERAEVSDAILWAEQDLSQLPPPCKQPGVLIANPPYGERLPRDTDDSGAIEGILLERFAEAFPGWRMGLLLPSDITPQHPQLQCHELARFRNGGIPVRFWKIEHKA